MLQYKTVPLLITIDYLLITHELDLEAAAFDWLVSSTDCHVGCDHILMVN